MLDWILVRDDPDNHTDTSWTSIIEEHASFKVLTKESQEHFQQASETSFVSGPIGYKIGPFEDNEYCDALIEAQTTFKVHPKEIQKHSL